VRRGEYDPFVGMQMSIYGLFVEKLPTAQRVPLRIIVPINGHVKPATETG
jgi:hypothetical protein